MEPFSTDSNSFDLILRFCWEERNDSFLIHGKLTIINLSRKNDEIKYTKIHCIRKQDPHILTQNGQN